MSTVDMVGPRVFLNVMQGRHICAPDGSQTHSPLSSSNYLLFGTFPRLCARKGVMRLPLDTSARSTAEDESLYKHNINGLRLNLDLNLLSAGNDYGFGT